MSSKTQIDIPTRLVFSLDERFCVELWNVDGWVKFVDVPDEHQNIRFKWFTLSGAAEQLCSHRGSGTGNGWVMWFVEGTKTPIGNLRCGMNQDLTVNPKDDLLQQYPRKDFQIQKIPNVVRKYEAKKRRTRICKECSKKTSGNEEFFFVGTSFGPVCKLCIKKNPALVPDNMRYSGVKMTPTGVKLVIDIEDKDARLPSAYKTESPQKTISQETSISIENIEGGKEKALKIIDEIRKEVSKCM